MSQKFRKLFVFLFTTPFFFIANTACVKQYQVVEPDKKVTATYRFDIKNSKPYHYVYLTIDKCQWGDFKKYYTIFKKASIRVTKLKDLLTPSALEGEQAQAYLRTVHNVYYSLACANDLMYYVRKGRSRDGPVITVNEFTLSEIVWLKFKRGEAQKFRRKVYLGYAR